MLDTIEDRAELKEKTMLLDGSLVSAEDAKVTIASVCRALQLNDGFAKLDRLFAMRLWADDLKGYIDYETSGDSDSEYAEHKKTGVNEMLMSPIFDLPHNDERWNVPPRTAIAVLRNMVGVNPDDGGEMWLQEPSAGRELLAEAWEATIQ